jgi:hypothetical protein
MGHRIVAELVLVGFGIAIIAGGVVFALWLYG